MANDAKKQSDQQKATPSGYNDRNPSTAGPNKDKQVNSNTPENRTGQIDPGAPNNANSEGANYGMGDTGYGGSGKPMAQPDGTAADLNQTESPQGTPPPQSPPPATKAIGREILPLLRRRLYRMQLACRRTPTNPTSCPTSNSTPRPCIISISNPRPSKTFATRSATPLRPSPPSKAPRARGIPASRKTSLLGQQPPYPQPRLKQSLLRFLFRDAQGARDARMVVRFHIMHQKDHPLGRRKLHHRSLQIGALGISAHRSLARRFLVQAQLPDRAALRATRSPTTGPVALPSACYMPGTPAGTSAP